MSLSTIAAAGFSVQMFEAEALIRALDSSCDLPDGFGMDRFDELLTKKWMEMDELLIDDLDHMGIEQPLLVEIEDDGTWHFVDGHHRLSWAVVSKEPVPVIFVTVETDPIELYELISRFDIDYDYRLTAAS